MKKIFLLALAAVFLLFTSCGTTKVISENTSNSWYKYNKAYTVSTATSDSDSGSTSNSNAKSLSDGTLYVYYDSVAGLTVVIENTSSKIFGKKVYTPAQFGEGKWSALIVSGKFTKISGTPASVANSSGYKNLSDYVTGEGIQWNKILVEIIEKALLGEKS